VGYTTTTLKLPPRVPQHTLSPAVATLRIDPKGGNPMSRRARIN
jgi:hypothetical protein